MNPGRLIFGFLFGMMLIAFLAIVTEVWWVVAAVGRFPVSSGAGRRPGRT